jgi:predicted NUDIX family NTP pyrophosphohydrolase
MPVPISAGTILYRRRAGDAAPGVDEAWEVLLVHPSGAYNRKAPWSIPKGLPEPGEALEDAARRETEEETGVAVPGELVELVEIGRIRYRKSKKDVVAFAGPAPDGCEPRCASWEIDRAEFVTLRRARELIHPDQAVFVDALAERLAAT